METRGHIELLTAHHIPIILLMLVMLSQLSSYFFQCPSDKLEEFIREVQPMLDYL